jgi:antitoxin MazE
MKTAKRSERMGFLVSKWGNSLAVRLPAESAKRIGVGEGDTLIGEIAKDGRLILSAEGRVIGKAEIRRMREFLAPQKKTTPVVAGMRKSARY